MFASRYFPKVGSSAVVVAGPHLIARQALFVAGSVESDTLEHIQRGATFLAGVVAGEGKS